MDTHIWIWSQDDPSRLSGQVARELENPKNEKWLSPISVWEFLLLVRKGRLKSPVEDPFHWLERAFSASPTFEATVTHTIAVESERIDVPIRDPADRLIAATAKVLELTLVTADERLMRSRQWKVLPNR